MQAAFTHRRAHGTVGPFAQHGVEGRDMLGPRAATATDHGHAVLVDEAREPLRHFLRAEGIACLVVDQFGQAGIGLD